MHRISSDSANIDDLLPFGLWLGRWFRGVDVRTLGSGNLGATNVFRELGPGLGIATMVLDATAHELYQVDALADRLDAVG